MVTFGLSRDWAASFVGRRQELAWLRSRHDLAARGYGHLVLVEGDAGVGKTRLVQAFVDETRASGTRVIRGRCYEHLDLAYLPLVDGLLAALVEALADRPDRRDDLELLRRIAGAGRPDLSATDAPDDQDATRQLLAITRLVLELAADQPVVFFVDDLDWADSATVDVLRHLLFRLGDVPARVLVVATARGDANARAAAGIGQLRADPRAATMLLHALTLLEATEYAREVRPGLDLDHARRLASAAGGNPLLVESLARQVAAPGHGTSTVSATRHPLVAAVTVTLDHLDEATDAAVRAAAFLVPDCTRDLLEEVTALPAPALDHALAAAVDAGVLVDDNAAIAFVHPLYAHTIRSRVSPGARRALQARIGTILLDRRAAGADVTVRRIAHHLVEAEGAVDRHILFEYAREAGDDASTVAAWSEAARCYDTAMRAAPAELDADTAVGLLRRAGLCHRANLDLPQAVDRFQRAIALSGSDADPTVLADLHLWRIRCGAGNQNLLDVARDRGPLEVLVDAIEATRPDLAAEGLVELAQSYWVDGDMDRAEHDARRAMAIAELDGDLEVYARATTALCVPLWTRYELRESLATLEDGARHARAAGTESILAGGPLFRLPLVLTWLGRLDEVDAAADECFAAAERAQYPLEKGLPLAALAQLAVARGEFDLAEQHAHQALLLQRLSGYHWAAGLFLPALMTAHVARGRFTAARDALETWAETADAMADMTIGVLSRYVDACERGYATEGAPLPRLPRAPTLGVDGWAAAVVETARREGAAAHLDRAYALLRAIDERGGVFTSGMVMLVPRLLGVAADQLGDEAAADAHLRQAISVAERVGAEPELARARTDLAAIHARRGELRDARRLVDLAAATFERLAMVPDLEHAEVLAGGNPRGAARLDETRAEESVVIFFSDVVDSTRHTEELGATRYRALARRVEISVRSAIVAQGGTVVSGINLGDGVLGLFPTPARAIAAARHCAAEVPAIGLHLHLAVHRGEAIVDGSRIYGGPVNYAARICDLSGPDEILVSEAIRTTADLPGVAFVDRGEHVLKGIEGPQRVFAVVSAPAGDPSPG